MSRKDNKTSLAFGISGLLLQVVGGTLTLDKRFILPGLFFALLGVALLCIGFAFYAKAKGQNPAWGILGLFGLIGLIVLALLPDNQPEQERQRQHRRKRSYASSHQHDHALAELERE